MSNLKIYKGSAWVDICDLDFRIMVNGNWKKVKPGDRIMVNGQWKIISCEYPFKWIIDPDESDCELAEPPYYFLSSYQNVSYPVTMTTGYTAGRPCAFSLSFNGSLNNQIPTQDNTNATTNLNTFGSPNRMFIVPANGTYRVRARLVGVIQCNMTDRDSQQLQTIRFVFARSGGPDIDLIALGQNEIFGQNASSGFCAPGQYVISKGLTVPFDINFEQNIAMTAGETSLFKMLINLQTHFNQQNGANETNTTNFNFTIHELEIEQL